MAEMLSEKKAEFHSDPLLTVAMPVFNAGQYLRLAVLSILRQTFEDWELLIIDDGSTDNALQELTDIEDPRIQIIRDGLNKGLAARLNEAIDLARGTYFARMDQDDVSYPERFSRQIELLQGDPRLDVVSVGAITISDNNEVTGLLVCPVTHEKICARPWQGFCFPHPAWMGTIGWFRKHRYATPGPYFCEDQELLLRTYSASRFGAVDEVLFAYRVRGRNNWRRVARTRWTFFKIQFYHFIGLRKFHYASLAMLVLAVLIARDFTRMVRQLLEFPHHSMERTDLSISPKWHEVLNATLNGP